MSREALQFRLSASVNDFFRDWKIPLPAGVACHRDLVYRDGLRLDVYHPEGAAGPLPTIVSIHGGGYVYGSKEIYRRYGMDMARRGFAFVNFNYRLAPKWKFPAPLEDANSVLEWVCRHQGEFCLDPDRVILVGDSAGAQLASQYAAIASDREYAALFPFQTPPVTIRALGLNCGMYDLPKRERTGIFADYLPADLKLDDPRLRVLDAIGGNYPPAYLATACRDFLRENARPMYDLLTSRGVPAAVKCYGAEDRGEVGHVFHVNIALPEAAECNDDECGFFRAHLP